MSSLARPSEIKLYNSDHSRIERLLINFNNIRALRAVKDRNGIPLKGRSVIELDNGVILDVVQDYEELRSVWFRLSGVEFG